MKTKIQSLFSHNWSEVTGGERNEIVFERLNKTYGAYEIRTTYDNSLLKAFSATGLLIALFVSAYFIVRIIPDIKVLIPDSPSIVIDPPPVTLDPIHKPETYTHPAGSTTDNLKPVVTDEDIKPEENIIPKNPNDNKGTGNPLDTGSGPNLIPSGLGLTLPEIDTTTHTFGDVDKMPNFPGGDEEMYRFLKSNAHIPEVIREIGNVKEKVGVAFTVEKDGSISSVELIRGGCKYFQLNNEAIRVIKKMPIWEPGEQKGKPVKVRYNIPMRFEVK